MPRIGQIDKGRVIHGSLRAAKLLVGSESPVTSFDGRRSRSPALLSIREVGVEDLGDPGCAPGKPEVGLEEGVVDVERALGRLVGDVAGIAAVELRRLGRPGRRDEVVEPVPGVDECVDVCIDAASKAALWSLTDGLRRELPGTQVVGLVMASTDTDMMAGFDIPKNDPVDVVRAALDGLEAGALEVVADEQSRALKAALALPPAP